MQRTRLRRPRAALAARILLLLSVGVGRPAAAHTDVQVDGLANVGYFEGGIEGGHRAYTEVRPALTLQFQSPRVIWRAGYVFAGSLTLLDERTLAYSNGASVSLAAQLSPRSAIILGGSASQGHTEFLISQQAPEAGQASFRRRTNPDLVTASLAESYVLDVSQRLRLGQSLTGTAVTPRDALGEYNASVTGTLALDRQRRAEDGRASRDAFGFELRSSAAVLRTPETGNEPFWNIRNAVLARWNHDFDWRWNGEATAGVEQVLTFAGSYPLAIVPSGELAARYLTRNGGASLVLAYGAATDLVTGTVTLSQGVTLRGVVSFDTLRPRQLGVSAGFLHAEPLGQATTRVAAGTGNAVQGDVGLVWGFSDTVLATARYSVMYQFGQPEGLAPYLAHVVLVGIAARYGSAPYLPPAPTFGARVDEGDRAGVPAGHAADR